MTIQDCHKCGGIDLGSFNSMSWLPEEGYCTCDSAWMNAEYAISHNKQLNEQMKNFKDEQDRTKSD